MKIIKKITVAVLASLPLAAGAVSNINDLFTLTESIMKRLVPIFIAAAVVILLYAIVTYITAGEDEEKRGKAKTLMLYGIIGLFVMVSIWGLVNMLSGTFELDTAIEKTGLLPF